MNGEEFGTHEYVCRQNSLAARGEKINGVKHCRTRHKQAQQKEASVGESDFFQLFYQRIEPEPHTVKTQRTGEQHPRGQVRGAKQEGKAGVDPKFVVVVGLQCLLVGIIKFGPVSFHAVSGKEFGQVGVEYIIGMCGVATKILASLVNQAEVDCIDKQQEKKEDSRLCQPAARRFSGCGLRTRGNPGEWPGAKFYL